MADVIYVDNMYQKIDLTKKALSLLNITQSYENIYETKKNVTLMQAVMLSKLNNLMVYFKRQATYWKNNYTQILIDEIQDKTQGDTPEVENIKQEYLISEEIKKVIKEMEEELLPYSDYIFDSYSINTTVKGSLENLEQTKQDDQTVLKYVFGKKITESLDEILTQTSEDYAKLQKSVYSMDSSFNKRLINNISVFQITISSLLEIYNKLQHLNRLFRLIEILFKEKADYSSYKMKNFIKKQDYISFEAVCKNYIEIL